MKETNPAVVHIKQPDTNLCWATSILMVMKLFKQVTNDFTPQRLSSRMLGTDLDDYNHGGYDQVVKSSIDGLISECKFEKSSLTWDQVKASIDNNKPVFVGYGWDGGGKHVMVIGGYEAKGKGDWGMVRLFDPLRDGHLDISFDRLSDGNYDTENAPGLEKGHRWDRTWVLK
jgi:hypothetical protein